MTESVPSRPGLFLALLALCLACSFALPAGAASPLERIRDRGELIVGTDATYPPFELKVGDRFEGFDIDLGNEIGRELGVRVRWENINWDGIFAALQASKFDLVISDVVITEKRKKELAFSQPYFLSGQTIARRRGDDRLRTSKDLPGKTVGVQQETTGQYAVEKLGLPPEQVRKFDTMQDALLDVRNRRCDAAVGDQPALREMIRKGYPELELVGGIFVAENYGVVARPSEPELLAAVNRALDKIILDGRYARIYQQWIREPMPADYPKRLAAVKSEGTRVGAARTGSALAIRPDVLREALPLLVKGAGVTLQVTLYTLLIGIPLGLIVALVRLSPLRPLSLVALVYVEVIRGTPLLMQIFAIYFLLPALPLPPVLDWLRLNQMQAAVLAMSLNAAAYISEIFRAGIESIDPGQMEAARSLGMDYPSAMWWVILPQTVRRILPPMTNETVALLKDTSLISIIGLAELTRIGREQVGNTGAPVTILTAVALLYLLMTLPLTAIARRLEVRRRPQRSEPTVNVARPV